MDIVRVVWLDTNECSLSTWQSREELLASKPCQISSLGYLIKKDKRLGSIIKNYPKDFLFSKSDPFYTLARSIIGQQISVKAAQAVWDRFEYKIKNTQYWNAFSLKIIME